MSKSDAFTFRVFSRSILSLTLALVGLSGCADVITYSKDAQRQGMTLYRQGDYANAAGAFRNSVRQNPRNYEGSYYLGVCYDKMGEYQLAIASYRTARQTINLTLEGKHDDANRERIITGLAAAIAKSDQRNVEADAAQREAESQQSGELWFLVAKIAEYRGDADAAIDAYNRASILEPNTFLFSRDFGLYLERLGQNDRAEAPLRRAYSLNGQDQQVIAALRRIGVVPGPGIVDANQLSKPIIPRGPIPQVQVPNLLPNRTPPDASTVQAPRD